MIVDLLKPSHIESAWGGLGVPVLLAYRLWIGQRWTGVVQRLPLFREPHRIRPEWFRTTASPLSNGWTMTPSLH